jgi:hypothetical protein
MARMGIINTVLILVEFMLFTMLAMTIDLELVRLFHPTMMEIGSNLQLQLNVTTHGLVLAQQFQNSDILGNIQNGWTDFLQTGKAGASAIGLVLGYMIRGITR